MIGKKVMIPHGTEIFSDHPRRQKYRSKKNYHVFVRNVFQRPGEDGKMEEFIMWKGSGGYSFFCPVSAVDDTGSQPSEEEVAEMVENLQNWAKGNV